MRGFLSYELPRNRPVLDAHRICVSGWEFRSACRQIGKKEHVVALSDHSDFNGLIEYVRRSKPKQVITDNYRVSHGEILAREIHKRLGIPAAAMPSPIEDLEEAHPIVLRLKSGP